MDSELLMRKTPGKTRPARAIIGKGRDRVHVVSHEDSVFRGGPLQENGIIDPGQPDIESADKIEVRDASTQTPDNPFVEVLIANQLEHPPFSWLPMARATIVCGGSAAAGLGRLDHLSNDLGLAFPPVEVSMNRVRMSQVVADHRVHVGEVQGAVRLDNPLGTGPVPEFLDDQVQKDSGVADPDRAVLILMEWNGHRFEGQGRHEHILL